MRQSFLVCTVILVIWIIIAPGCMTFRKADAVMKKQFRQKGVALTTAVETIEDRHMHYAKTGADSLPTIVFIHGTPGSWDAFAGYMQDSLLLKQFRMISVDRPGFGYSDFGKAVPLKRQAELIHPLIARLSNDKPVYLAGHSLGGPLLIQLESDYPGSYQSLVIISGSVDPAEEKPEKWRPWLFKTPLNLLIPGALRPSNEELWYLKKDLVSLQEAFYSIRCPVYFIHGDKDSWVPPGNVDYAKKLLVNAREVGELMIPGGNHFIPWTRFPEIRDVLLNLNNSRDEPEKRFETGNTK